MSASRWGMSIRTTSVLGSAALFAAMQTNILPRTFNAGTPQDVATSTSGRPALLARTASKPLVVTWRISLAVGPGQEQVGRCGRRGARPARREERAYREYVSD